MLFMSCVFMLLCLFIAALWSLAGKGLTSWLLFVMLNCVFVAFQCGILGQAWYLIVWIPDLCCLSYSDFKCLSCLDNLRALNQDLFSSHFESYPLSIRCRALMLD